MGHFAKIPWLRENEGVGPDDLWGPLHAPFFLLPWQENLPEMNCILHIHIYSSLCFPIHFLLHSESTWDAYWEPVTVLGTSNRMESRPGPHWAPSLKSLYCKSETGEKVEQVRDMLGVHTAVAEPTRGSLGWTSSWKAIRSSNILSCSWKKKVKIGRKKCLDGHSSVSSRGFLSTFSVCSF